MISFIKKITFAFIVLATINNVNAQLTVNGALTPTFLVNNVLLGTGITASGITYTGDPTARGEFNGTLSNIGFTDGVLLSTGNITNAIGPNNIGSAGTLYGTTSTDPQLASIASGSLNDVAILEFDFVPTSDSLKFRYVFASEEYLEFVASGFNDVFGFFISGPNPAGGSYTNQNIAIIPGTGGTPVTIDNVNTTVNPSFYFDNGDGSGTGSAPDGTTVQYDGFTVPLTARAAVTCGQTYHIKIAIADVGDDAYDSGVFLEAGSFSSQGVTIVPQISYGGANDSTLYEGCGTACIYFVRTSNIGNADTVNVTIGGSAVNGVDYNTGVAGVPLPTQLYFAAGQDSISYCINAVADGITEGLDTITLAIVQSGTGLCVTTTTNATIYINEYAPLTLTVSDTTFCNMGGTATLNTVVTGGVQPYIYSWTGGLPPVPDPSATVTVTTNYIVTVTDACTGSPDPTPAVSDTATVTVATFAPLTVNAGNDMLVCPGDMVNLSAVITGGGNPYIYDWITISGADSVTSPHTANTSLSATGTGTYQIAVTDVCGNHQNDQVSIAVEPSCVLNIPNIITPDGHGPAVNEFFYVDNLDKFPGSSLAIYNRWGNKIYESADYANNWSGSKCVDGVYYYILTVPVSGKILAKAESSSSYRAESSDANKVFAGYFQITRMK
ncbi:MAG: choice-of-anchor L domain-containing protein [Bacteroidia bacterium]